eukprot:2791881-Prymnesium_polylepis.1
MAHMHCGERLAHNATCVLMEEGAPAQSSGVETCMLQCGCADMAGISASKALPGKRDEPTV